MKEKNGHEKVTFIMIDSFWAIHTMQILSNELEKDFTQSLCMHLEDVLGEHHLW